MGVHGLWKILEPAHRPVKLESLARKRLAVDASIWIYHFLKAVRDQEGNALSNSHIVGFFRRICKLLFHGIKPVFVFDGGAPVLKRQTIAGRKQRREGRKEDAARAAARLLALQVKKRGEEEAQRRRTSNSRQEVVHDVIPEDVVYVDQLEETPEKRKATLLKHHKSRTTDQYQLPELDYDFTQLGAKNDVRLLTEEELKEYAKQFNDEFGSERDVDFDDLTNIDFDSPFFKSLPDADRYRILNMARLRSRLRMGYSKEQLDKMFPDRMAFSRFQIERVARRNELSQRVMNLMNNEQDSVSVSRVAGEKGKEYILVRNEGPGGGWVMSFVGGQEGDTNSKPIDVEKIGNEEEEMEDSEEDEMFEDVPIEGLNRLPKPRNVTESLEQLLGGEARDLRRTLYKSRREQGPGRYNTSAIHNDEDTALFYENETLDKEDELDTAEDDSRIDADLQNAITMSLGGHGFQAVDMDDEDLQRALQMSMELPQQEGKGKGRAIASDMMGWETMNDNDAASGPDDFQRALIESKKSSGTTPQGSGQGSWSGTTGIHTPQPLNTLPAPLKLNSGSSFLMGNSFLAPKQKIPTISKLTDKETEKPVPLPPWFTKGKGPSASEVTSVAAGKSTSTEIEEPSKDLSGPRLIFDGDLDADTDMEDVPNEVQHDTGNTLSLRISSVENLKPPTIVIPDSPQDSFNTITHNIEEQPETTSSNQDKALEFSTEPINLPENNPEMDINSPQPESPKPNSPPPSNDHAELDDIDLSFEAEDDHPTHDLPPEDADELELLAQLAAEDEEHTRFAASLTHPQPSPPLQPAPSTDDQIRALHAEKKAYLRDSDEVTATMIAEVQSLLTFFGLPYITAPQEAEAQCAELVRLGLVDGIVTDDSDVFLFGGTRVFRYMFNDRQTVQCYLSSDLEKEFALDRERLIQSAHLLGSDYTEGIPGVGPVTAIELLAEFPGKDGLRDFRAWWELVQKGLDDSKTSSPFRRKLKKQLHKLFLPANFPDPKIDDAYLHPIVDSDPSPFQWGVPDLDGLRGFLVQSLGWSREKTDQVLVPVVRDMNRKMEEGGQANITRYFEGGQGMGVFAPRVREAGGSARMVKAMKLMHERVREKEEEQEREQEGGKEGEKMKPMSMRERMALEKAKEQGDDEGVEETIRAKGRKRKAPSRSGRARKRGGKI